MTLYGFSHYYSISFQLSNAGKLREPSWICPFKNQANHTALARCDQNSTVLANKDSYMPPLKMDRKVNAISLNVELIDKACPPKTVFYIPTYTYQERDSCAYSCGYSCEHYSEYNSCEYYSCEYVCEYSSEYSCGCSCECSCDN